MFAAYEDSSRRILSGVCKNILSARSAVERGAVVRPDLRDNPEPLENGVRTARHGGLGEVEVERERPSAEQVDRSRRVEQGGDLGETVAPSLGNEGSELRPRVGRQRSRHRIVPSSARSRRFRPTPAPPYA